MERQTAARSKLASLFSNRFALSLAASALPLLLMLVTVLGHGQPGSVSPVAVSPYTVSVFATSSSSYTQPDSIAVADGKIFVGFGNGVAKDGSDGKSSTIVEYSSAGAVLNIFSVKGHNDGLKTEPETERLWALQNEDGNPNLVIIDPESGEQKAFTFGPTAHGGGYDDIAFSHRHVFLSASNPTLNSSGINTLPAIVTATLSGNTVQVAPVLAGNATAIDIPTGTPVALNLKDPDSMRFDLRGNLMLDSQDDAELIFVRNALSPSPTVGHLAISGGTKIDDTVFATSSRGRLLVSDRDGETIYAIESPTFGFEPGAAFSATPKSVASLNLDTGALADIVTGLASPHGMHFLGDHEDRDRKNEEAE